MTNGILKKIHAIQSEIVVEKTGYNEKHEFTYFKEEDVLNAVKKLLNQHGVVVRKKMLRYEHSAFYDNNGRYRPRANADVQFTFVDIEDGSEFPVEVSAEGSGTGDDVSSRKLATQARKIAYLDTFQITEQNDRYDGDSHGEQEPVNNSAPVEEPEVGPSLNELQAAVGRFVNGYEDEDGKHPATHTGPQVNAIGTRIAKTLKVDPKPAVWRKDINVLAGVVEAMTKGEVE